MATLPHDENTIELDEIKRSVRQRQPSVIFDGGGEGEALLRVFKARYDALDTTIGDLFEDHYVETASGENLERLGLKYQIERKSDETDEKLRKRIQAARLVNNSRGTYRDIAELAIEIFEAEPYEISILRPRDTDQYGQGEVRVANERFEDTPFTKSEISNLLSDAAVAGHRIIAEESSVFRFDDADNGFGSEWGATIE